MHSGIVGALVIVMPMRGQSVQPPSTSIAASAATLFLAKQLVGTRFVLGGKSGWRRGCAPATHEEPHCDESR